MIMDDHQRNIDTDDHKIDDRDEVMLPGFRFHPTDEELVGFYLKRKIQQQPLSIELIKQLDIYKYDPWDLPKLASIGEKEWYFYCPRDRKYRNSARPNRVTGAGFWKATGTDRPIYNSEGSKCIGLKKSLVFYKGRAAKGIKTDWMMHEFRLPAAASTTDSSSKRYMDRHIPATDAWAICRIFKKTHSAAQRALSYSWVSPLTDQTTPSDYMVTQHDQTTTPQFSSDHFTPLCSAPMNLANKSKVASFAPNLDVPSYGNIINQMASDEPSQLSISNSDLITSNYTLSSSADDASSLLLNMSSSILGDFAKATYQTVEYYNNVNGVQDQQCSSSFLLNTPQGMQGHIGNIEEDTAADLVKDPNVVNVVNQWGSIRSVSGFPYCSLPLSLPDALKLNVLWESSPSLCEISANYSTNNCYT